MLALFAQKGGGDADAGVAAMMASMMIPILIGIAIGVAIQVFFCLTLSKALKQVRPENRELEPGQVWLLFIPIFSLYWVFVVTSKVPASLKAEFRDRGMGKRGDDYGANVGKWYAICIIASVIPCVGSIAALAGLVLWIMFWVRIAGYGKELSQDGGGDDRPRSRSRDEDDDEDDAPRKKKRRSDDDDDDE